MPAVLDPSKARLLRTVVNDKTGFLCAAVDQVSKKLYLGGTDLQIHAYDLPAIEHSKHGPLRGHTSYVTSLKFLPGLSWLISGGFDKQLLWWSPEQGSVPVRRVEVPGRIQQLAASDESAKIAAVCDDLVGRVWDARSGSLLLELKGGHPLTTRVGRSNTLHSVAFSPDGKRLATGDRAGTIRFWDANAGKPLHQAANSAAAFYSQAISQETMASEYEWGGVRTLLFSPDGKMLVAGGMGPANQNSAGTDGPCRLEAYDVQTGKSVADFLPTGSKGLLMSLAFHPAGEWLFGGGGGGQNGVGHGGIVAWNPRQRDKDNKPVAPVFHKSNLVIREVVPQLDGTSLLAIGALKDINAGRIEIWDLSGKAPVEQPKVAKPASK